MFERCTERARQVIVLAQDEARTLKHNYIGTEHILLGLVREDGGVGSRILRDFDADPQKVRSELIRMLSGPGRRTEMAGRQRVRVTTEPVPFRHADNRPAQLLVAHTTFTVEAEGDRDCAVCGGRWTIAYNVSWKARQE